MDVTNPAGTEGLGGPQEGQTVTTDQSPEVRVPVATEVPQAPNVPGRPAVDGIMPSVAPETVAPPAPVLQYTEPVPTAPVVEPAPAPISQPEPVASPVDGALSGDHVGLEEAIGLPSEPAISDPQELNSNIGQVASTDLPTPAEPVAETAPTQNVPVPDFVTEPTGQIPTEPSQPQPLTPPPIEVTQDTQTPVAPPIITYEQDFTEGRPEAPLPTPEDDPETVRVAEAVNRIANELEGKLVELRKLVNHPRPYDALDPYSKPKPREQIDSAEQGPGEA